MSPEPRRLTAVVGASRGIGRHLARRAARRGDAVLACARDEPALVSIRDEYPEAVEVLVGDFLSGAVPLDTIASVLSAHPGPVSLIVTAATLGPVGPLVSADFDEWTRVLVLDVAGPARILATAQQVLTAGDLVVLFSGGGVGGPNPQPNVSGYTTAKAAVMHLVEVAAREKPDGPALVAIAPGAFPTGFTDPVLAADPALAGRDLVADVERTRTGPFDAAHLEELLDYLETADISWLSGRSLSARRDTPDSLRARDAADRASADLLRMRRVDGTGVTVQSW